MHPKRREPGDVGGSIFPAEPCLDPGDDFFGGYRLHILFQILETDPAPARERRKEQQAIRTADDAGLVARERCRHRDVGDQKMPTIGRAFERLAHRVAGDAVRPARADDDARTNRLHRGRLRGRARRRRRLHRFHLCRSDPALDHAAERREMGLEDPLGFVLRQAALELAAAVDAIVAHGAQLRHVRAVHAGAMNVLGRIDERRQQANGIQDLERAGLDRRSARLAVRLHVPLDEPRFHAVAGELGSSEQPGGPAPMIKTSFRVTRSLRKANRLDRSVCPTTNSVAHQNTTTGSLSIRDAKERRQTSRKTGGSSAAP